MAGIWIGIIGPIDNGIICARNGGKLKYQDK
jgi:hypothetical protein